MNKILNIIKHTLGVLQKSKVLATPLAYEKEFIRQAQKYEDVPEIIQIKEIINNLSNDEKNDILLNDTITSYDLVSILNSRVSNDDLSRFINHLKIIMEPSLDKSIIPNIDKVINAISLNPKLITNDNYINKIKELSKNRIILDRNLLNAKSLDITKIFTVLGKYLDKSLIQSKNTKDETAKIKEELSSLNLSNNSHRELISLQQKLVNTILNLETSITKNQIELLQGQEYYDELEEKIIRLEKDLKSLSKERNTDYLTGILNRRAFQSELDKIDNEYKIFESKYAIIFYDLDHFKNINDEHGHDCGDTILKSFASLLNKLTRVDDIVSRYGGEEFVVLVHYKDEDEVYEYVKRVKDIMNKNSFVYNDILVKVKFSAGVSLRSDYKSYEDALIAADKYLYQAKFQGRDRIIYNSGTIL
ncbi:MAG: GGDEF domain-containing protein [Campylobacteraceae bacterium]|nr:GGDEF domain-containing protein [Campylobacteraceae bacterium]